MRAKKKTQCTNSSQFQTNLSLKATTTKKQKRSRKTSPENMMFHFNGKSHTNGGSTGASNTKSTHRSSFNSLFHFRTKGQDDHNNSGTNSPKHHHHHRSTTKKTVKEAWAAEVKNMDPCDILAMLEMQASGDAGVALASLQNLKNAKADDAGHHRKKKSSGPAAA